MLTCVFTCAAIVSIADLKSFSEEDYLSGRNVRTCGTIIGLSGCGYAFLEDESGSAMLYNMAAEPIKVGDIVETEITARKGSRQLPQLIATKHRVVGSRKVPPPVRTTVAQVFLGAHDCHDVVTEGLVSESFTDEIDPECQFLILSSGGYAITVLAGYTPYGLTNAQQFVGARIRVTGAVQPTLDTWRHFLGRRINTIGPGLGIEIIEPQPPDPFQAPPLSVSVADNPSELSDLGLRRIAGRVLAVWQGSRFLLDDGKRHPPLLVSCAKGVKSPQYGEYVSAVGIPSTDLFGIILSQAHWKPQSTVRTTADVNRPMRLSARSLLLDENGRPQYHAPYYGRLLTLHGTVRNISVNPSDAKIHLDCDGFDIPVDVSARPDALDGIGIGYSVDVTGVCLMDIDPWRPNAPFPHITGVTLVIRTPTDIVVTARPSWWTPQRLFGLVIGLFAALIGFATWNRLLNRLVNRRSRQLLKEQIARASADLRVGERTRLAVELHDSLSQNLAGVACQITATKRAMALRPDQALPTLEKAERMLLSSRSELKRCLWDLRSDALEETDTTVAIRKTLEPVLGNAKLLLRFSVPRNQLTDSTMHAILSILRELCSNAVRHGQATTLRVAGALDGNALVFSVNDDGCGFDAAQAPGPESGHFGLAGIRERAEHVGGSVEMNSNPANGTYTRISIPLIRPATQENLP